MQGKNIVLIGMPGAGKSTVGSLLSRTLQMNFIDTDLLIVENTGDSLQNIIDSRGIEEFLKIEEKNMLQLKAANCVIATGGSVIYSTAAVHHLRQNGVLIYLYLSPPELQKRITNISTRGIARRAGQKLTDLHRERAELYAQYADITIDCSGKSAAEIVTEAVARLHRFRN